MTVRKVSLSVNFASVQLGLQAPLQEFPAGRGQFFPESVAAGGTAFQRHRKMQANVYAADSLPTENGYGTVSYKPWESGTYVKYLSPDRTVWLTHCEGSDYLMAYNSSAVNTFPHTPEGHLMWLTTGTVLNSSLASVAIKGINPEELLGVIGVKGRLVGHDTKFVYWSGFGILDFTPSLSTGAGSSGHTADIGKIVQLVPADDGFYILGTRGGLFAKCTGDAQPFSLSLIPNFDGISEDRSLKVCYSSASLTLFSNSGLCEISPQGAQFAEFDKSRQLCSTYKTLQLTCTPQKWGTLVDIAEYIDTVDCETTRLYYEKPCDIKVPVVTMVSPNYVTVSFGWDSGIGAYTRLLVLNKTLMRESVLHVDHTDVNRAATGSSAEFILTCDGVPVDVAFGDGIGTLIYHNLQRYSADVVCISKLSLSGTFAVSRYTDEKLQTVEAQQGVDILDSAVDRLDLTRAVTREVQYAGRLRQRVVSLKLHWSGDLSGVTLEYA